MVTMAQSAANWRNYTHIFCQIEQISAFSCVEVVRPRGRVHPITSLFLMPSVVCGTTWRCRWDVDPIPIP